MIRRTPAEIARAQERAFLVTMAEDTQFRVRAKKFERVLRPNDLIIGDLAEQGTTIHSGCTALNVRIPEAHFKRYLPGADDLHGVVVRGDRGAGLIAATMLRALAPNRAQLIDAGPGEHIATALLHAIAAAYAQAHGVRAAPGTTAAARRHEITRFVDRHLRDADLSVSSVATAFRVSDRYVRMLFADHTETLSAYIHRRRLEECARQLRDPLWSCRTISETAFAWGFNSLGSFDRAFKAHFDLTPRQYRERAAAPTADRP